MRSESELRLADPAVVTKAIALLKSTSLSMSEIAEHADVSVRWLRSFRNGEIPNPGVLTLQPVVEYVTRNL